jgi:hypothetical protein
MKTNDNQMTLHTPGPWTFEGHGGYERKRADGSPWRSLNVGTQDGACIAEVCIPKDGTWAHPEAIANRALIAAAPCLLAALQRLVHPMADDEDREHAEELIARIVEGKA